MMRLVCLMVMLFVLFCGVSKASEMAIDGDVSATNVNATGVVKAGSSLVGSGISSPGSVLHVYENTANTGTNAGLTIGQAGSGNAVLQFNLPSVIRFQMGIDNGDSDKFKISQSSSLNSSTRLAIDNMGNVGINNSSPSEKLDVGGGISAVGFLKLLNITWQPSVTTGMSYLYCYNNHLYAADSNHNRTEITPHIDPREIVSTAQTSFADPNISYPFSFYHKNAILGKEQIIDMAKLVAWAEKKMMAELGDESGRVVFTTNLPTSECLTFDQAQAEMQANWVMKQLSSMPLVKVSLGADNKIPDEAFIEYPECSEVIKKLPVTKKAIDFTTRRLVEITSYEDASTMVPTGRMLTKLKDGWELREDGIYRKPTINDVNIDAILANAPQLPRWILDRIKVGQQSSMDIKVLVEQIRRMLAEKQSNIATKLSARMLK